MEKIKFNNAFTLAEILIVLAIVGVIAGLVIPNLINDMQNEEYKTGYKKAYADASTALKQILADNEYTTRSGGTDWEATRNNWNKFRDKFNIQKNCSSGDRFDCWEQNGDCAQGMVDGNGFYVDAGVCSDDYQPAIIDNAGRSWTTYNVTSNLILVDVNGFKLPNRLGRDRWAFCFANSDNSRADTGTPVKVLPYSNDNTSFNRWCPLGNCFYSTWLFGKNGTVYVP